MKFIKNTKKHILLLKIITTKILKKFDKFVSESWSKIIIQIESSRRTFFVSYEKCYSYNMAKVYLIGGTPRVGKTTLLLRTISKQPMLATSSDAIRYMLRQVISRDAKPDLFHLGKFTSNDPERVEYLKTHSMDIVNVQNKEAVIVWKSVKDFIHSNLEDGFDVLIEGIHILPEFVKQLDCDYKAVFLGNKSDNHFQTILNFARKNENDWMHSLEDETIEAFSIFNKTFSQYIETEANKYDLTYIEMHDDNFESDIESALDSLLR